METALLEACRPKKRRSVPAAAVVSGKEGMRTSGAVGGGRIIDKGPRREVIHVAGGEGGEVQILEVMWQLHCLKLVSQKSAGTSLGYKLRVMLLPQ